MHAILRVCKPGTIACSPLRFCFNLGLATKGAALYTSQGEDIEAVSDARQTAVLDAEILEADRLAARIRYKHELSELRRRCEEVGRQEAAAKKKRDTESQAAREVGKLKRQQNTQERYQQRAAERAKEEEVRGIITAAKKAQGRVWRNTVSDIYGQLLYEKIGQLHEDSRKWIRPEELDARINEALDNPLELYPGEYPDEVFEEEEEYVPPPPEQEYVSPQPAQ